MTPHQDDFSFEAKLATVFLGQNNPALLIRRHMLSFGIELSNESLNVLG
jgi:hypothetical protein